MAKCVELHKMSYKIAKSSLHPMAKFVELQQTCFKTATFYLCPNNLHLCNLFETAKLKRGTCVSCIPS